MYGVSYFYMSGDGVEETLVIMETNSRLVRLTKAAPKKATGINCFCAPACELHVGASAGLHGTAWCLGGHLLHPLIMDASDHGRILSP